MTRIATTGHRPDKLGGYDNDASHRAIRRHMRTILSTRLDTDITLISGGALGIDQFWMEVGLHLGLPVIAALPFKGYDDRWPRASRDTYKKLLDKCSEVLYVCEPGYEARKLQTRNEWMVDNSDLLTAYWNGTPGGTKNCVDYAKRVGRQIQIFDTNDIIKEFA